MMGLPESFLTECQSHIFILFSTHTRQRWWYSLLYSDQLSCQNASIHSQIGKLEEDRKRILKFGVLFECSIYLCMQVNISNLGIMLQAWYISTRMIQKSCWMWNKYIILNGEWAFVCKGTYSYLNNRLLTRNKSWKTGVFVILSFHPHNWESKSKKKCLSR